MSAGGIGFEEGRTEQLRALRRLDPAMFGDVVRAHPRLRLLLLGIGASHAALATPLWELRNAGVAAFRSTCADLPGRLDGIADLAIIVSQGGRSREPVEVAGRLAAGRVPTFALTNASDSPLRRASDSGVAVGDFPDSRVSTVGFVTTFAALGMITDLVTAGRVDERWQHLPDLIPHLVDRASPVLRDFAARFLPRGSIDLVASSQQSTAGEAVGLLFREGPLVPAAAYDTRSYLHGPMDCAGSDVSHIVIGGRREMELAHQLRERTEAILVVTTADEPSPDGVARVEVPGDLTPSQRALVEVCVLQQLVAETARARGNAIDDAVFVRVDTKLGA
jgi:glucosamine--fructose-6-phosphate aminotransferase (isomerizing)